MDVVLSLLFGFCSLLDDMRLPSVCETRTSHQGLTLLSSGVRGRRRGTVLYVCMSTNVCLYVYMSVSKLLV